MSDERCSSRCHDRDGRSRLNNLSGFYCQVNRNAKPFRGSTKWKITKEEYEPDVYPDYCYGILTICSLSELIRMYEAAKRVDFLWVEDTYTTGVLRKAAGVEIRPFNPQFPAHLTVDRTKLGPDVRKSIAFTGYWGQGRSQWIEIAKKLSYTGHKSG